MAHIKFSQPRSDQFDAPIASLIDVSSRGIDQTWHEKRAAAGIFKSAELRPSRGHSLIHLIGMGDSEIYGGNRNGDFYYGYGRQLDIPEPDWESIKLKDIPQKDGTTKKGEVHRKSPDTFSNVIRCGNSDRAWTFSKFGHVFKDHKNKPYPHPDPDNDEHMLEADKIHGAIKAAAHNPEMHRVEIIAEVPNNRDWEDDLEKIARGVDIPWSMAAKVKHDLCLVCGHLAANPDEYCFVAGTPIVMADFTVKPIENICEGDVVLDGSGKPTRVIKLFAHDVKTNVQILKGRAIDGELITTSNHPVLVRRRGNYRFVPADAIADQEEIYTPVPACDSDESLFASTGISGLSDEDKHALSRLVGYYAAEGSTYHYNRAKSVVVGVEFCFHDNETAFIDDVCDICERIFGKRPRVYTRNRADRVHHATMLRLIHKEAANWLVNAVPGTARTKRFSSSVVSLPVGYLKDVLGAFIDGDGHATKGGQLVINIAAKNLVSQLHYMLLRIGVSPSCNHYVNSGGPFNRNKTTTIYRLGVAGSQVATIAVGAKVAAASCAAVSERERVTFTADGLYAKQACYTVDEVVYAGTVYNFETESHTYVANNVAVHNCDHAANHMTALTKQGHFLGVANEEMTYFDMSRVRRPADRIAWSLYGIADKGEKRSSRRDEFMQALQPLALEQISGRIQLLQKAAALEKRIPMLSQTALLKGVTPTTNPSVKVANVQQLPELFRVLADAKICLPFEKWAETVTGDSFPNLQGAIAIAKPLLKRAFSMVLEHDAEAVAGNDTYNAAAYLHNSGLRTKVAAVAADYAMTPEALQQRAIVHTLRSTNLPNLWLPEGTMKEATDLVKEYTAYKLAFLDHVRKTDPQSLDFVVQASVLQNFV